MSNLKIERNISAYSSHSRPYCVVDIHGKVAKRCESRKEAEEFIKSMRNTAGVCLMKNIMPEVIYVQFNVDYPKALEASVRQIYKGDTKYQSGSSVEAMQAKHTKELDRLTNVMKGMELGYQDQIDKLREALEKLKDMYALSPHIQIICSKGLGLDSMKDGSDE